ncbi:MAG: hypothetical protein ACE5OZ_20710 [Candidatus Heimdallarchaeota archaeon]
MKNGSSEPKSILRGNRKQIAAIIILVIIAIFFFLQESSQTAHLSEINSSGSPEDDTNDSQTNFPFLNEILGFLERIFKSVDDASAEEGDPDQPDEINIDTPVGMTLSVEFLLLILFLILVIGLLGVSYYFLSVKSRGPKLTEEEELHRRLDRLGERVERIIAYVDRCIDDGNFTNGVIKGYKELDQALWDFSRLQRRKYDTPLEHTQAMPKLLAVDRLRHIVEQFYGRRYRMADASKADLLEFKMSLMELVPSETLRLKPDWEEQEEDGDYGR